ncbi:hypothetical protein BC833DRAFT_622931 [Globomyces pollinis-pini]|nr:hypothetical protein BC833DRAFT_622931 [Globomyces pollinis-pini]KAJ2994889.1 Potassium voltage-gated channel sub H member 8 [Globomyces sp. JEL0801]
MSRHASRLYHGAQREKSELSSVKSNQMKAEKIKVEPIAKHTWYEELNFKLDVLIPLNEDRELLVPLDSYLQQVHYGRNAKWRIVRNQNYNLPPYLSESIPLEDRYDVHVEKKTFFGPLELNSPFLKKWDRLALILLLYTAVFTPYQTAYINSNHLEIDLLFCMDISVDLIFLYDIFIQMRTPFRDATTGKLILDVKTISISYLSSWFPIDILSTLPFDLIAELFPKSADESATKGNLKIVRLIRLTRLLKLLRVFRASRKLKQLKIASGLRYGSIQLLQIIIITLFLVHWFGCGYGIVSSLEEYPPGWIVTYPIANNYTTFTGAEKYVASLYWSAGVFSLVGISKSDLSPANTREYLYSILTYIIAYLYAVYCIALLSAVTSLTGEVARKQEILVDGYLKMFDDLRLDSRLKYTVYHHLNDHFASLANAKQTEMLHQLPKQLHCFISMEIYVEFVLMIPFLEPFIDLQPNMIQEICQGIEKRLIANNNMLFTEGFDGIYYLEEGIVAMDGVVYPSGSIIGLTILRENIKSQECRAITDCKLNFLPRKFLIELFERYPKVRYYCKRWTQWQVLRDYILTYSSLYYTAARRGALMSPPLLSKRPCMEDEEDDDIDVAVLDHIEEMGF